MLKKTSRPLWRTPTHRHQKKSEFANTFTFFANFIRLLLTGFSSFQKIFQNNFEKGKINFYKKFEISDKVKQKNLTKYFAIDTIHQKKNDFVQILLFFFGNFIRLLLTRFPNFEKFFQKNLKKRKNEFFNKN